MSTTSGTSGTSGSSGTNGTTGTNGTNGTSNKTNTKAKNGNTIDKDMFLKLMVAQLRYQDPTSPADTSQFLAQTAQFTMVESLNNAATYQQQQLLVGASSMIGKTVTYTAEDQTTVTGVVTAASLSDSTTTLRVGNTDVPLSSVREVHSTTS